MVTTLYFHSYNVFIDARDLNFLKAGQKTIGYHFHQATLIFFFFFLICLDSLASAKHISLASED